MSAITNYQTISTTPTGDNSVHAMSAYNRRRFTPLAVCGAIIALACVGASIGVGVSSMEKGDKIPTIMLLSGVGLLSVLSSIFSCVIAQSTEKCEFC